VTRPDVGDPRGSGLTTPPDRDGDAVARVAAGDPSGLADLYDRHARALYSLAYRMLSNRAEAEDLVQDVFSQAWRQAGRYDARRAGVGTWLLMMTRARALDRLRARRVRAFEMTGTPATDVAASDPDQETHVITAEEAGRLRAALQDLPDAQRKAIELAYYGGLSQTEIAEQLREPLGTIKTRIRTGLLRLRDALQWEHWRA
jgi:RNA polymerase sigma-70 factor (ECF subfamily)